MLQMSLEMRETANPTDLYTEHTMVRNVWPWNPSKRGSHVTPTYHTYTDWLLMYELRLQLYFFLRSDWWKQVKVYNLPFSIRTCTCFMRVYRNFSFSTGLWAKNNCVVCSNWPISHRSSRECTREALQMNAAPRSCMHGSFSSVTEFLFSKIQLIYTNASERHNLLDL